MGNKLNNYWVVIASDGSYALFTIAYQRKEAIRKWLEATRMNWSERKKYNWKVVKINIEITEV
jgi:phosphoribosyl-AMP cyclohydrolase